MRIHLGPDFVRTTGKKKGSSASRGMVQLFRAPYYSTVPYYHCILTLLPRSRDREVLFPLDPVTLSLCAMVFDSCTLQVST